MSSVDNEPLAADGGRYAAWLKKIYFPSPQGAALGFFGETWAELDDHPGS